MRDIYCTMNEFSLYIFIYICIYTSAFCTINSHHIMSLLPENNRLESQTFIEKENLA